MAFSIERWQQRQKLPMDERVGEVLELLKGHRVVICEAETGSGKTSRIGPAAIIADPALHVTMTQTRRIACYLNAKWIASEMGCEPGQLVGWRLHGEKKMISPATRLELMIDQSLVNRIQREGALPKGLIIVDEAHERSISIDLLLGLIKDKLATSKETRVLITSATIDTQKFAAFFDGAPVLSVKARVFPIRTEVFPLLHGEHHTQGAIRAACSAFQQFLCQMLAVPGEGQTQVKKGTVLVLLPGKEDIQAAVLGLESEARRLSAGDRIQVFSCSGESSKDEQNQIQDPIPEGVLRFVCCTEVLRNSLTARETVGVIDSLQVKRMNTNAHGVAHLAKEAISQAEADQGKGRAGRTGPGFYWPVSFGSEYWSLVQWPVPAILREPLSRTTLQVAAVGRSIREFALIDAPPQDKVEASMRRLKCLAALADDESITETGRLLLQFPLDPERAKALITADKLGVLAETVIVTAVLEVEGIFQGAKEALKTWSGEGTSDFAAIVRGYRAFKAEDKKRNQSQSRQLLQWCQENGLNLKRVRLAEEIMRQICEEMASSPLKLAYHELTTERVFDQTALGKALATGMFDNLARNYDPSSRQFRGRLGEFKLAFESLCPAQSPLVLVDRVQQIPHKAPRGRTTHFQLATLAAPIEPVWLLEIVPHLCIRQRLGDHRYLEDKDCVVETEVIHFQDDLELQRSEVNSSAKAASRTFASWLAGQSFWLFSSQLSEPFQQIFRANAERQKDAAELNRFAQRTLFKVFTHAELTERYIQVLAGAERLSQVAQPEVLALPPLDPELIVQVLSRPEPIPTPMPAPRGPADPSCCLL